ncbi:MAG: anaphase-promoting complex subunit 10 [Amphiamblys sp. WSBS2006]|nr:MAG: anaphase-promoting complex subunit 10 [Amphiamblys sp. WSBS2006]
MERKLSLEAQWTVSSSRHKNGIENAYLDTDNQETYWASDSSGEHFITVEFPRLVLLQRAEMLFNYEKDESYTPQKIQFQVGSTEDDLQDLFLFDVEEHTMFTDPLEGPNGWCKIRFPPKMVGVFVLRFVIKRNFLDGRDTRIRGIKLF